MRRWHLEKHRERETEVRPALCCILKASGLCSVYVRWCLKHCKNYFLIYNSLDLLEGLDTIALF